MIYFDNAATTFIDPAVAGLLEKLNREHLGNASSVHQAGVRAALLIEKARESIARTINAQSDEIFFTSGGTESNNLAVRGAFFPRTGNGCHVITTAIEHSSVLLPAQELEREGCRVTRLPVDREGAVDPGAVLKNITPETRLVTVMHANNEIGTLEPIREIGAICRERGVWFHTDACQSFTKAPFDVRRDSIDLASLSAHKVHGPRGVGALYVRKGLDLKPLLFGGGQENGLRPGTYNTEGIAAFGMAAETAGDAGAMAALRDYGLAELERRIEGLNVNGPRNYRLCNLINVTLPRGDARSLMLRLSGEGIMVATGSACHANRNAPSHVLKAIGLSDDEARRTLRISLSKWSTREEMDRLIDAVARLQGECQ